MTIPNPYETPRAPPPEEPRRRYWPIITMAVLIVLAAGVVGYGCLAFILIDI